jgi:ligand-binding sensor domain-containing protein
MRLFLLSFLLLLAQLAGAQVRQNYLFSSLSSRNGLVSEETVDVQQDEKGFIWVATVDGLQRFEGRRLLTFRHTEGDTTTIPNDNIQQMRLDKRTAFGYYSMKTKLAT